MTQSFIRARQLLVGSLAATIAFTLSGCATPRPTGPTVMALPKQGESFEVFQQHDITCRQYAATQTGDRSPQQAAARNAVGGAAVGAAAGALIGSASGHAGNGAAIGAGSGLLAGTLMGSRAARKAAASVQQQYNTAYTQCMVANGDRVTPPRTRMVYRPGPPPPPAVIYAPAPVYVAPPPPVYVAPAPVVVPAYPPPPPRATPPSY